MRCLWLVNIANGPMQNARPDKNAVVPTKQYTIAASTAHKAIDLAMECARRDNPSAPTYVVAQVNNVGPLDALEDSGD